MLVGRIIVGFVHFSGSLILGEGRKVGEFGAIWIMVHSYDCSRNVD